MAITPEKTEQLAQLSRLSLSDGEVKQFAEKLSAAVAYSKQIRDVDTEAIEPMIFPVPIEATMRADQVAPSLSQEEALANAPQVQAGMFRVPRIIEEE